MAKLIVFFVMVFLAVLSIIAYLNKGSVDLTLWEGYTYPIPVIALILASTAVGILSMTIIVIFRGASRYFDSWQVQRLQKKEAKIRDSYGKALEAFYAFRYEEAEELFLKIKEDDPSNIDAVLRLGDIYYAKKEYEKSREMYMKAMDIKPRSIEVLLSLERVSEVQRKWQDAIKYLDSILEIDAENLNILHKKRDIYERNSKWEEVNEVQARIQKCKLSPEDEKKENENMLGYKYELARHYLNTGATDKASRTLRHIIKTDKDFTAAYLAIADAHEKEGNLKEAESVLRKGFEATSSLVILARLEDYYITGGEPGTIIDIYQKALQNNNKSIKLQFFLAKLYFRLEMIDHALETLNVIDATSMDYPELHVLFGNVYERRSEYENAIAKFKKALNADEPLVVPFCCSNCSSHTMDWSGRCPDCKSWNTYILDINEACKLKQRQSST
jgi:tetratricopeptide (TPR) repeat protein